MFTKIKTLIRNAFPSKSWVQETQDKTFHTPDMWRIEMHENQLVFLYDQYMTGHSQHKCIEDIGERLGTAFTYDKYTVWNYDDGRAITPIAMKDNRYPNINPSRRVKGELYSFSPKGVVNLDILKQNGVQFRRRRVKIIVPSRPEVWVKERDGYSKLFDKHGTSSWFSLPLENRFFDAWIYFGTAKEWFQKIEDDTDHHFQKPTGYLARNETLGMYTYFSNKDEHRK